MKENLPEPAVTDSSINGGIEIQTTEIDLFCLHYVLHDWRPASRMEDVEVITPITPSCVALAR